MPRRCDLQIYGAMAGDARRTFELVRELPFRGGSMHGDLLTLRASLRRLLADAEALIERMEES